MTDESADRTPAWQAGRAEDLSWAEFGDDYLVYHRPSGQTHVLNSAMALLLTHVLLRPKTALAAAEELAEREQEQAAGDTAFLAAIADSLEHLEHLGLVERS